MNNVRKTNSNFKKILFIGAGASFGARESFSIKPPLGPELLQWLKLKSKLLENKSSMIGQHSTILEAKNILDSSKTLTDYEQFVASLKREDRIKLHRLIQIMFTDLNSACPEIDLGFKEAIDLYDNLINQLKIDDTWILISLNYDILLEQAFDRSGIQYLYPCFPFTQEQDHYSQPGIRIYKPHGSINFFGQANHQMRYGKDAKFDDYDDLTPTKFNFKKNGEISANFPTVYAGMKGPKNVYTRASDSLCHPVMANYTKGKDGDINDDTLEKIRKECIDICKQANEIIIIGVRPILDRADDPVVSEILSLKYTSLTYVVKDTTASLQEIKSIHPEASLYFEGLKNYLQSI